MTIDPDKLSKLLKTIKPETIKKLANNVNNTLGNFFNKSISTKKFPKNSLPEVIGRSQVTKRPINIKNADISKWNKVSIDNIDPKYLKDSKYFKNYDLNKKGINEFLDIISNTAPSDKYIKKEFKNVSAKNIYNDKIYNSKFKYDSLRDIYKKLSLHKNKKKLSPSDFSSVVEHDTKFAISSRNGIQGCHGQDFYEGLIAMTKGSTRDNPLDITRYINDALVDNNRFSEVLAHANPDGSLNIIFRRGRRQTIEVSDLVKFQSRENPNLFLYNYNYNSSEGVKTTCPNAVLGDVFAKIDEHITKDEPIDILSPYLRNGEELSQNGFFQIKDSNKQPFYFFISDKTIFPVEPSKFIIDKFPDICKDNYGIKALLDFIPLLK